MKARSFLRILAGLCLFSQIWKGLSEGPSESLKSVLVNSGLTPEQVAKALSFSDLNRLPFPVLTDCIVPGAAGKLSERTFSEIRADALAEYRAYQRNIADDENLTRLGGASIGAAGYSGAYGMVAGEIIYQAGAAAKAFNQYQMQQIFETAFDPETVKGKLTSAMKTADPKIRRSLVNEILKDSLATNGTFMSLSEEHKVATLRSVSAELVEQITSNQLALEKLGIRANDADKSIREVAANCKALSEKQAKLSQAFEGLGSEVNKLSIAVTNWAHQTNQRLESMDKQQKALLLAQYGSLSPEERLQWLDARLVDFGTEQQTETRKQRMRAFVATSKEYLNGISEVCGFLKGIVADPTVVAEIEKAANMAQGGLDLYLNVQTGNPMGALRAAGAILGAGSTDPAQARHAEVMGQLANIEKLQRETIERLKRVESKIDDLRRTIEIHHAEIIGNLSVIAQGINDQARREWEKVAFPLRELLSNLTAERCQGDQGLNERLKLWSAHDRVNDSIGNIWSTDIGLPASPWLVKGTEELEAYGGPFLKDYDLLFSLMKAAQINEDSAVLYERSLTLERSALGWISPQFPPRSFHLNSGKLLYPIKRTTTANRFINPSFLLELGGNYLSFCRIYPVYVADAEMGGDSWLTRLSKVSTAKALPPFAIGEKGRLQHLLDLTELALAQQELAVGLPGLCDMLSWINGPYSWKHRYLELKKLSKGVAPDIACEAYASFRSNQDRTNFLTKLNSFAINNNHSQIPEIALDNLGRCFILERLKYRKMNSASYWIAFTTAATNDPIRLMTSVLGPMPEGTQLKFRSIQGSAEREFYLAGTDLALPHRDGSRNNGAGVPLDLIFRLPTYEAIRSEQVNVPAFESLLAFRAELRREMSAIALSATNQRLAAQLRALKLAEN